MGVERDGRNLRTRPEESTGGCGGLRCEDFMCGLYVGPEGPTPPKSAMRQCWASLPAAGGPAIRLHGPYRACVRRAGGVDAARADGASGNDCSFRQSRGKIRWWILNGIRPKLDKIAGSTGFHSRKPQLYLVILWR